MKKFLLVLAMVFIVKDSYLIDGNEYYDFILNDNMYRQVYVEDMACMVDKAVRKEMR